MNWVKKSILAGAIVGLSAIAFAATITVWQPGGDLSTSTTATNQILANTTVTPGSYTAANITVDSKGRIIAASNSGAGSGSVSSVGLAAPTGFTVSGSPVTTSGTLTLSYTSGYQGFTTANASTLSTALQPGANITNLTNNAGFITSTGAINITGKTGTTKTLISNASCPPASAGQDGQIWYCY